MTALPATRQSAELIVDRCAVRMLRLGAYKEWAIYGSEAELDALIALAKRGADTVGATEAWLSREGFTYTQKIRPEMRRCLILPESSEG